ncbi:LacI family DNA-binding transcriptional regulator [Algoriphagus mannitolivorans]|uniref:LacI family DNA-binding transcriptional regulator n=1 Tax=Algoriphagus mannitolivorans TaxID=226504 RepID=UPI0003F602F6|nr:LacI family DNA-binding transcriptional regulator [Algoriphagus mannitolivorans]
MKLDQATIKDLARELNVSSSTISRALKDYPGISDETKRKVREMAEKMNYRPNALARSLRKSQSFTIGVIIPEVVHFFFSTVISGIEEVAFSKGYNVILTQTNEKVSREKTSIDTMLANQIDGLLVSYSKETEDFEHFSRLLEKNFPIVFFDRVPKLENTLNVTVDDYQGAYAATQHLIQQGYRKIYHLAGPKYLSISTERARGYLAALEDYGIQHQPSWIIESPRGNENEAKDITTEVLKRAVPKPDAFFAHNDMAAVGAMMACRELGLKVPDQIGIVGFSDWQFCTMLEPSLSSVAQPGFQMGVRATELLLDMIDKKGNIEGPKNSIVLETELLIRKSSQKP